MRRSRVGWLVGWALAGGLGLGPGSESDSPVPLEKIGRFTDPALAEVSGIVRSRRYPGIFWVHNDSGNLPTLFAVRRDGSVLRSYRVEAPSVDWEDIAADDHGHLYLGDIGNNGNRLPLRAIYRVDEPDVTLPADDQPLRPTLSTYYRFPEGERFDAESLFIAGTRALVIAKRFDGRDPGIFAVPLDPPARLLRPALPIRVASLAGCVEPATGADLSSDGRRLAVVTTVAARVYQSDGPEKWSLVATVRFEAPGVEAIAWDGDDLILASEDRSIYRIPRRTWLGTKEGTR